MRVRVIGCGEAFDSGVGNNSYLVSVGSRRILIDCGYQIPERLWAQNLHRGLDAIYFTHTHADHAFGIVPLLVRYWEERRRRPLTIIGHRGVRSFVEKALELGFPGFTARLNFPVEFITVKPGKSTIWSGLSLDTARSEHGVTNLSVRFSHGCRSCAFSGDGAVTEETQSLYEHVDLLFHELFSVRRKVPGHTNVPAIRELVENASPKRVVVSHHARRYKSAVLRAVADLDKRRVGGARWIAAQPGQTYTV